MSETATRAGHKLLGSAEIRKMLSDYVRRRVPESDVDDVVQTVLVEALASERVPEEKSELRKWLTGVARHKIADHHRRAGRERPAELPDIETQPAPVEEQELARWAEKQARASKEGDATLRWMAREGEGDKLEHIAEEERLPAATVRQRVSRMRRWMKERWLAELAAAAAVLGLLVFLVYKLVSVPPKGPVVEKEVTPPIDTSPLPTDRVVAPSPLERAAELRREALKTCEAQPRSCLDRLDEAKRLDPAGDRAPEVQGARRAAEQQLEPQQQQQVPSPEPSSTAPAPNDPKLAPPAPTFVPIAPPTSQPTPKGPSKESAYPSKQAPSKPQPKSDVSSDFGSQPTSTPPAPQQSPQMAPPPEPPAPLSTSFPTKAGKPTSMKK